MTKPIAFTAQRLAFATVVVATLGAVFGTLTLFGLGYLYRLGWCISGDCTAEVMQHAAVCAVVAAGVAGALILVGRQPYSSIKEGSPAALAIVYAVLMALLHPYVVALRATIGESFFPYVTSIRFGWLGFVLVWAVSCAVLFSLVAAAAMAAMSGRRSERG